MLQDLIPLAKEQGILMFGFMAASMTISFLGTGSGVPTSDRVFFSTLIHLQGKHLLLDAGEPCVHSLQERGNLLPELDAVLITHGHVDHIGGLPALLQGCKLRGRTKPLPVYLPGEMIAPLRAWISALYLPEEGLGFSVIWTPWKNAFPVELTGGVSVTPYRNGHLDDCYRGRHGADDSRPCDSYSLILETGDHGDLGRILFTGDLAAAEELPPLLGEPLFLVVSELSHFSPDQLAGALASASIKTLCLVHLDEEYARDRSELKVRMEELLPGVQEVLLPEDGEALDF